MPIVLGLFVALGLSFLIFPGAWTRLRTRTQTNRVDQAPLYVRGQRAWGVIVTTIGVAALVVWLIWGRNIT